MINIYSYIIKKKKINKRNNILLWFKNADIPQILWTNYESAYFYYLISIVKLYYVHFSSTDF